MKPWPEAEPSDEMIAPPDPCLEMREISDVEMAFPANVSPRWEEAPLKYWIGEERSKAGVNRDNPWIRLASDIFYGQVDQRSLRMPIREGVDGEKAYRWLSATLRSYELSHEYKEVSAAWILESFFWAYWIEGKEPGWVLNQLSSEAAL